jgi:arsenite methyltransferase
MMEKLHETLHNMEHHFSGMRQPKQHASTRADYGQDVPIFTLLLLISGMLFSGLAVISFRGWAVSQPILAAILVILFGSIGLVGVASGFFLIWASRVGKYQMRDRIMAQLDWRGDEQVLDVGCGAGLLLIGAAQRLTTGKATGVDIWDKNLEYGSDPENVWANARIEGVTDRIAVKDGNACSLPFHDNSFDLVTSSDMLHHLSSKDRIQAVGEMARVLKPGGKLVIAEIAFTKQFIQTLKDCGVRKVDEAALDMVLWRAVIATK